MLCTSGLVDGLASSQQILRQFAATTLKLLSHVNMFDENALNRVTKKLFNIRKIAKFQHV